MGTENKKNSSNNNKKRQRYLPHNRPVKKKGAYPLKPGVQGFFITCDGGKERQAAHEAMDVIDSFYEELVNGVEKKVSLAGLASKPMNKKIKFESSDSDSSSSEDENDGNDEDAVQKDEECKQKPDNNDVNGADTDEKDDELKNESDNTNGNNEDTDIKDEDCKHKSDSGDKDINNNEESVISAEAQPNISSEKQISESEGNKEEETKNQETKEAEPEERPPKKQCLETVAPRCKSSGNDNVEKQSVDKLIEAELAELGNRNKRRFSHLDTGCNGVVFVQMRKREGDPSPKSIIQHMMTSLASSKKHVSRFMLRVLPVEISCYASDEEISRAIKPLIEQFFPVEAQNPLKFSVIYDARANTGIDRMKIIDAVAKSVPQPHKVDLNNPDINVVVQIVRTVCLIGVVEKYKELAKYNIRQLTSKN